MKRKKESTIEQPNFRINEKVIIEERSLSRIIGKGVNLATFIPELDLDLKRVWTGSVSRVLRNRCYFGDIIIFHETPYYEIAYDKNQNNGISPPQYVWESGLHIAYIRKFDAKRLSELQERLMRK